MSELERLAERAFRCYVALKVIDTGIAAIVALGAVWVLARVLANLGAAFGL